MAKSKQLVYLNKERCLTAEYLYNSLKKDYEDRGRVVRSIENGRNVNDMINEHVTEAELVSDGFELLTGEMLTERGVKDHAWYCRNILKILPDEKRPDVILTGAGALIPLNPLEIQEKFLALCEKDIKEKGFVRLVIVKAGRLGMSTIAASYLWSGVHLVNGTVGAIIAHQ